MTPALIFTAFAIYTILLFGISFLTSGKADNETFMLGNRRSPWYIVAYGMIGASLSGVTFISIPGDVQNTHFSYMVIVLGYLLGYFVIANVLLPLYYKLQLTSIYTYLEDRFGFWSYKTGAVFFLISRIIGASFRMFLVVSILQIFVFDAWGIPFWATVAMFIVLIMLYTFRGGIKTIVWTDTLQTTFMLVAVVLTLIFISRELGWSFSNLVQEVRESEYSRMFITEWQDRHFMIKDFLAGMFIAIVMTGLDQDMMQKNLSCRNLKDAKKNIYWLSIALIPVNLLFLSLGAVLWIYASKMTGFPALGTTDELFPTIALQYLGPVAGITFIIGLIAAAYSSADSALTALTTSFSVDILNIRNKKIGEKQKTRTRYLVHIGISIVVLLVIILFNAINDRSVISSLFTIAGYTYGPLLGMFAFGLLTKYKVNDRFVPLIAILSPAICYVLSVYDTQWFMGYDFGFELLLVNGFLTFTGLFIVNKK
ncbi:MAG: sodium:solute symporter [Bacteroidetes bacterium]|nr:MAG: sodium:solute symporter [Bacteroidota bacterium]RLD81464.1 MAG: sodium:solute symporter [Bacteroidota bacterium]